MSNQRFISFLTLAIVVATLYSCKKPAKHIYTIDLHTSSTAIKIPATTYDTSALSYGPSMVSYNVDSFIQAQTGTKLTIENIKTAHIVSIKLIILDTTAANHLGSFENIASTFTSDKTTTPYTRAVNAVPDYQDYTINIPADSTEMKSYFGTIFNYSVSGKLRRKTTADMHCKVEYVFKMDIEG